jgi:hypothetical protein
MRGRRSLGIAHDSDRPAWTIWALGLSPNRSHARCARGRGAVVGVRPVQTIAGSPTRLTHRSYLPLSSAAKPAA